MAAWSPEKPVVGRFIPKLLAEPTGASRSDVVLRSDFQPAHYRQAATYPVGPLEPDSAS